MAEHDSKWRPETIAVHAGRGVDPVTGAVAAPIHLSTTFQRAEDGSFPGFNYTRTDNPNRAALETALAQLEGGAVSAAFASGVAAAMSLFQTLAPNDHVIAPVEAYYGIQKVLRDLFGPLAAGGRPRRHDRPRRDQECRAQRNQTHLG